MASSYDVFFQKVLKFWIHGVYTNVAWQPMLNAPTSWTQTFPNPFIRKAINCIGVATTPSNIVYISATLVSTYTCQTSMTAMVQENSMHLTYGKIWPHSTPPKILHSWFNIVVYLPLSNLTIFTTIGGVLVLSLKHIRTFITSNKDMANSLNMHVVVIHGLLI